MVIKALSIRVPYSIPVSSQISKVNSQFSVNQRKIAIFHKECYKIPLYDTFLCMPTQNFSTDIIILFYCYSGHIMQMVTFDYFHIYFLQFRQKKEKDNFLFQNSSNIQFKNSLCFEQNKIQFITFCQLPKQS